MMEPHDWAGLYTLDESGNPVPCYDTREWGRWMESGNRRVCLDYDEGDADRQIRISTVFLGVDHAFGQGPPVLWETMAFIESKDGSIPTELDGTTRRYSSLAAALIGHQEVCELVMKSIRAAAAKDAHG